MHTLRYVTVLTVDRVTHAPLRTLGALAAVAAFLLAVGRVLSSEDE